MVGRAKVKDLLDATRLLVAAAIKIDAEISDELDRVDMEDSDVQKFEKFQQALEYTLFETESRMETVGRKLANYDIVTFDETDVWCLEVQKFSLTALIKHYHTMGDEYWDRYYASTHTDKTN